MEQSDHMEMYGVGTQATMNIDEIGATQTLTNELIMPIPKLSGEGIVKIEESVA